MRVLSVVGARPQFIKATPVSLALADAGAEEIMVHTGQHYDDEMSAIFFRELAVRRPDKNLGVGSGTHGEQTGRMLPLLEAAIRDAMPDWVVVYGDTNSTLAGALAAAKLGCPVAHVEAGLRSFNRSMPEEYNRIVADHCSDLLLCPTATAVRNLEREGLEDRALLVGDTMLDMLQANLPAAEARRHLLDRLGVQGTRYALATIHRHYNTDVPHHLESLFRSLGTLSDTVVLPLHPRTRQRLAEFNTLAALGGLPSNVKLIDPVGYLDMLVLLKHARVVLTDSGGVQKEAYLLGVPCITLRPETEWVETVEQGWNVVVGIDPERMQEAANRQEWPPPPPAPLFGGGDAGVRIVRALRERLPRP